jgi:hypothetical protein
MKTGKHFLFFFCNALKRHPKAESGLKTILHHFRNTHRREKTKASILFRGEREKAFFALFKSRCLVEASFWLFVFGFQLL